MPRVTVTDLSGESRAIDAEVGLSLMESLRENDFDDLAAICGGCCSCCTCHVYVGGDAADKLDPMDDDEQMLLEDSPHYQQGESRLSCQIEVTDDLEGLQVTIVAEE
ncbi:ferredoxin [Kordiimonas sediminis]|uniref:Ferredoxin n=1 Tax=Kordiimonas sediminis TaxID=1735581 RepID=A0A919E4Z4_9PROT|nr:2Fe-2S iron-sulfur cluster-binding protein [Kordiimonas sediminis]GHF12724.1 ferredoxin [Kordiimonas sediminis]